MSSRASTTELAAPHSTPLKRKREKPIVISSDGPVKEEPYFLDEQAMQRVVDLLTQDKWINDDCINKVLEAFNPDPATWYVASTHLVTAVDHPDAAVSKKGNFLVDPPRKLVFPLHLPSMSHWTLVIYDRKQKRCLVYDPLGLEKGNELALGTVQKFLKSHHLWEGDVSVDLNPYPSVRQTDGVNCGVFVIAAALHTLHGKSMESITPRLWRELLAAYFCNKTEPPREWTTSYLAGIATSTDSERTQGASIERKIEDAEAVSLATSDVRACIDEIRLLLELVDVQTPVLEKREQERSKLMEMRKWCLGMPAYADRFMKGVVAARADLTTTQLKALPKMIKGGTRQLRILRRSCSRAVEDCEQVKTTLERKRIALRDEAVNAYHDFGSKLAVLGD